MITMSFGLLIVGGSMIRPRASSAIVAQRATRKTPLINAPRISALCHPYELALEDGDVASLIVYKATTRDRTSLLHRISYRVPSLLWRQAGSLQHMERVGHKSQ
jgi:hypothetical protein